MRWVEIVVRYIRPLRRPLGWACLVIALLGFVFPVIPGWPFIVPAILLLGRRDRTLRLAHLFLRRTLRAMRTSRIPWLRLLGLRLSAEYLRSRHALRSTLSAAQRSLGL